MSTTFLNLFAGLLGGITRSVVGIVKKQETSPAGTFQVNIRYVAFSLVSSGFIGMVAGLVFNGDWHLGILAGYAGSDFLENMFKIKFASDQKSQIETPPTS